MPQCSVPKCSAKYYGLGFCDKHYKRFKKYGDPLAGYGNHASPEERFWRFVPDRPRGKCWLWTGGDKNATHAVFQRHNRSDVVGVHRYSYELHNGPIPPGMVVMHSCDVGKCVNPAHLSLGTNSDNMQDMIAKGRQARIAPRGTDNGKSKLTPAKVRDIRKSSETNAALAEKWGLSPNTIRGVRIGRTWAHIK